MAQEIETEQLVILQQWWQQYRRVVFTAVVMALAVTVGWNLYAQWNQERLEKASDDYQQLLNDWPEGMRLPVSEREKMLERALNLHRSGRGLYSLYGAMIAARIHTGMGDADSLVQAAELLRDLMASAGGLFASPEESVLAVQAQLSLARLEAVRENYAIALELLEPLLQLEPLQVLAEDLHGDILRWQGRDQEAVTAYQKSLAADALGSGRLQALLLRKLSEVRPSQKFYTPDSSVSEDTASEDSPSAVNPEMTGNQSAGDSNGG